MIQTYKNKDGGKIKVFFTVDDNKHVTSIKVGNRVVPMESGLQFYVDKHVAEQIDKVDIDFSDGKPLLVTKEGESIKEPQKTEKELRMEELQRELDELQGDS